MWSSRNNGRRLPLLSFWSTFLFQRAVIAAIPAGIKGSLSVNAISQQVCKLERKFHPNSKFLIRILYLALRHLPEMSSCNCGFFYILGESFTQQFPEFPQAPLPQKWTAFLLISYTEKSDAVRKKETWDWMAGPWGAPNPSGLLAYLEVRTLWDGDPHRIVSPHLLGCH